MWLGLRLLAWEYGIYNTPVWVQAARGVHGSTYNKALASLKSFTPDQVAEMEEAAAFLTQSPGVLLSHHLHSLIQEWPRLVCPLPPSPPASPLRLSLPILA